MPKCSRPIGHTVHHALMTGRMIHAEILPPTPALSCCTLMWWCMHKPSFTMKASWTNKGCFMPPLSTGSCDISIKYGVLKMKPERIALQSLEKESYQIFLTKTSRWIQIEGSFGKEFMNDLRVPKIQSTKVGDIKMNFHGCVRVMICVWWQMKQELRNELMFWEEKNIFSRHWIRPLSQSLL
jgi:hypothetical protein